MIRLYADENVDDRIIRGLRHRGIYIVTVFDTGMSGKPDLEQLSYAAENSLVLLTSDQDFLSLHSQWLREGKPHAGIIYYSQFHVVVGTCIWGVKVIADILTEEEMKNHLEFISP